MEKHHIEPTVEGHGVWWHPDNRGPLAPLPYILQFGSMKFSKVRMDYTMYPHAHPGIGIRFIHSGKFDWTVNNQKVELFPDDISITKPWQMYGSPYGKTDIGEYSWMLIQPSSFSQQSSLDFGSWSRLPSELQEKLDKQLRHDKTIVLRNAKKMKHFFIDIRKELKEQNIGYEVIVCQLIDHFFIELYRQLLQQEQQVRDNDTFVSELRQMISRDFTKKWLIEDLALKFGMGKTKFTEEVRRLTGYPPASFILNLKIDQSIELLNEGKENLTDIAFTCGFSSLQHFTSTFSSRIGVGPGKYRKA